MENSRFLITVAAAAAAAEFLIVTLFALFSIHWVFAVC